MNKMNITAGFFPLLAAVVFLGCPKQKPVVPVPPPVSSSTATATDAPGDEEAGATADIGTDWATAPSLLDTVYFTQGAASLDDDARASLKKNAAAVKKILTAAPGVKIRVEGHCDERGTLEYNLALGERRGSALRDYYVSLGIPRAILGEVSYGEERPVCSDSSEACWARNRRGETTLRSSAGPVKIRVP